ncbi:hypothetical protein FRB99_000079 [Tulasnella sp. 403]|nr:hypothetical protein FRB99_000079 [Tulasnella sp. 403]
MKPSRLPTRIPAPSNISNARKMMLEASGSMIVKKEMAPDDRMPGTLMTSTMGLFQSVLQASGLTSAVADLQQENLQLRNQVHMHEELCEAYEAELTAQQTLVESLTDEVDRLERKDLQFRQHLVRREERSSRRHQQFDILESAFNSLQQFINQNPPSVSGYSTEPRGHIAIIDESVPDLMLMDSRHASASNLRHDDIQNNRSLIVGEWKQAGHSWRRPRSPGVVFDNKPICASCHRDMNRSTTELDRSNQSRTLSIANESSIKASRSVPTKDSQQDRSELVMKDQEIINLQLDLEELRQRLQEQESFYEDQLEQERRSLREAEKRRNGLEQEVESLRKEVASEKATSAELTRRVQSLEGELSTSRGRIHDLERGSAALDLQLARCKKQVEAEQEDKEGLNIALSAKQQELDLLKRTIAKSKREEPLSRPSIAMGDVLPPSARPSLSSARPRLVPKMRRGSSSSLAGADVGGSSEGEGHMPSRPTLQSLSEALSKYSGAINLPPARRRQPVYQPSHFPDPNPLLPNVPTDPPLKKYGNPRPIPLMDRHNELAVPTSLD